jgi:hypothetical protein
MTRAINNHVNLYGAVTLLEQEINGRTARVFLTIETEDGTIPDIKVLVKRRRALETLAFYQAHQELHPNEPFVVSIQGRLHKVKGSTVLESTSITFQVAADVTRMGGRLAYRLVDQYIATYGPKGWLETKG